MFMGLQRNAIKQMNGILNDNDFFSRFLLG